MSKNFRETLNEQLRDPAFQAEWETLEPERQIIRAIIEGRERCDLTQQQLAQQTGRGLRHIQNVEKGRVNLNAPQIIYKVDI